VQGAGQDHDKNLVTDREIKGNRGKVRLKTFAGELAREGLDQW